MNGHLSLRCLMMENAQNMGKKIWELFVVFLKLGAFTFGGGYAMVSLVHHEVVEEKKWITDDEMLDMVAIAEATPGVIAVNTATFVGYKIGGLMGSIAATLGTVVAPFIIIVLIAMFFIPYMSNKWIGFAFDGIRSGVVVLIINAAIKLNKVNKKTAFNFILTAMSFLIAAVTHFNVIFILIGGAVVGIIYNLKMSSVKGDK